MIISCLPYLLALGLFYSLAIHMDQALGGWPEIGREGFPPALLLHDRIHGIYFSYLFALTVFAVPSLALICLCVSRWRYLFFYLFLHLVSFLNFLGLMQFAPAGYLYWWWD